MKKSPVLMLACACFVLIAMGCSSKGQAPADGKLYSLEGSAQPAQVAPGASGEVTIRIKLAPGTHIADEAPFKAALTGRNVRLTKTTLAWSDAQKEPDGASLRVPFTAETAGTGAVEAALDFRVCTDKACLKQVDKISVPVIVK
jgi:hypothetical protein